jgi:hypothetical protein
LIASSTDADRGDFWHQLVLQLRGDNAWGHTAYKNKEKFMHMVHTWFDEPDIGMASIAWDLVDFERGEDNL